MTPVGTKGGVICKQLDEIEHVLFTFRRNVLNRDMDIHMNRVSVDITKRFGGGTFIEVAMTTKTLTKIFRNPVKLIGLAILISLVSVWVFSTDYPKIIKNRYFAGPIENYMSVGIGDERAEVLYKLGKPPFVLGDLNGCTDPKKFCGRRVYTTDENSVDFAKIDKDIEFYEVYEYENNFPSKDSFSIFFDNKRKVRSITCQGSCDPVFGIFIGSDERDLTKFLGNPSGSKIDVGSGVKTISYSRFNLSFYLEKMKIYMIVIGTDDPIV